MERAVRDVAAVPACEVAPCIYGGFQLGIHNGQRWPRLQLTRNSPVHTCQEGSVEQNGLAAGLFATCQVIRHEQNQTSARMLQTSDDVSAITAAAVVRVHADQPLQLDRESDVATIFCDEPWRSTATSKKEARFPLPLRWTDRVTMPHGLMCVVFCPDHAPGARSEDRRASPVLADECYP